MTNPIAVSQRPNPCDLPPEGWTCSRGKGHDGPCAARRPSRWDGVPELVDQITDEEGATVTFTGQNPDFNGLPNEVVVIHRGPDWGEETFRADTLADCLKAAIRDQKDHDHE